MRDKLQIRKQNKEAIFKLTKTSKYKSDTKRYRNCIFKCICSVLIWGIGIFMVIWAMEENCDGGIKPHENHYRRQLASNL